MNVVAVDFDVRSERELCLCRSLLSQVASVIWLSQEDPERLRRSRVQKDARLQKRKSNTLVAWKTNRRYVGKVAGIWDRFDAN